MKSCRRCSTIKPLSEFYTHKSMADGHLNVCRECVKARVKEHREKNLERIRAYDRERGLREERKEARRRWYRERVSTVDGKERFLRNSKKWASMNWNARHAHIVVSNAVRDGKLAVQPCERCGRADNIHAHHEDYTKPLDVNWLCRDCHGVRHREINEARRAGK